jgi:hypothetical protein
MGPINTSKSWIDARNFDGLQFNFAPNPPFAGAYFVWSHSLVQSSYARGSVAVPGWKGIVAREGNASGAMTLTVKGSERFQPLNGLLQRNQFNAYLRHYTMGHKGYVSGLNVPPTGYDVVILDPSFEAVVQQQALTRFYKKIRQEYHQFQGGVFLGEIGQTVKQLLHPCQSLKKGILDYYNVLRRRRRNVHGREPLRKILSDTWLEFAFGWQPLLSDCKDAVIALARITDNFPREMIKAFSSDEQDNKPVNQGTSNVDGISYDLTRREHKQFLVIYYGRLKHSQIDGRYVKDQATRIAELSGFDLRSFAPTAWELIPWSFLVDYFSNVGDIIDAVCTDTQNLLWVNRVEIRASTIVQHARYNPKHTSDFWGSALDWCSASDGAGKSTYKNIIRFVNASLGIPEFRMDLGVTGKQIANMAALIAGGKVPRPFY